MIDRTLYLSDLITQENIISIYPDFEFAGVKGCAEVIGYKIHFFRTDFSSFLDAVRFFEITDSEEIIFCNFLLEKMNFPVKFGDSMRKVRKIFGKETGKSHYLVNCDSYHYILPDGYLIYFDISTKSNQVTGLEIVYHREIIDNIQN